MKQTLLIIDMQEEFESACDPRVIRACRREIHEATKRGDGILYVEYEGDTPVLPDLTMLTDGYPHAFTCVKVNDDGSQEVNAAVWNYDLPMNFRVCGVNSDCCVWETVYHLRRLMPGDTPFEMVADAMNLNHECGEPTAIERLLRDLEGWKSSDFPVVNEDKLKRRIRRLKKAA